MELKENHFSRSLSSKMLVGHTNNPEDNTKLGTDHKSWRLCIDQEFHIQSFDWEFGTYQERADTWTKSNLCCKDRYSKQRTWHIGKMLLTLVHSKNLTNYFFIIQCLDITKKAQTKFQNQMISVIGFKEKQNKILSVSIRYHIKDMYKEKDFVYLVT